MANHTFQYNDEAMRNGSRDLFLALVLVVPRVEELEEQPVTLQVAELSFP